MTIAVEAEGEAWVISTEAVVVKPVAIGAFETGKSLVYLAIAIIIDASADPIAFFTVGVVAEILLKGWCDLGGDGPPFEFGHAV